MVPAFNFNYSHVKALIGKGGVGEEGLEGGSCDDWKIEGGRVLQSALITFL